MAITNRQPVIAPVYHSERGTQYTSIAFSDRLAQLGLTPSMGSRGDAFDKAWASYCAPLRRCGGFCGCGSFGELLAVVFGGGVVRLGALV